MATGCVCPLDKFPGVCERHGIRKAKRWAELCRTREPYWRAYEEGRGPGQNLSKKSDPPAEYDGPGPNERPSRCLHHGPAVGMRTCDQCGYGGEMRTVYRCAVHGECADREGIRDVKSCRWCEDFRQPAETNWPFGRVVCINLDRRPDRWREFCSRFAGVDRFQATDGWQPGVTPEWWNAGGGAWGCRDSHVRAIRKALADRVESILLMEDDAKPVEGFWPKLHALMERVPDDWELLYLGGQHMHWSEPRMIAEGLGVPYNVSRTHAWAIHRRGMQKVLSFLEDLDDWSNFVTDHIDHRMGRMHEQYKATVYCAAPWLVIQGANASDIDGQTHEDRDWNAGDNWWPDWTVEKQEGITRVAWYVPDVHYRGGVEVWIRDLASGLDRERFHPVAIARERDREGPALEMPVPVTTDLRTVLANSDVVIAWAVESLDPLREHYKGPVILVSHGCDEWSTEFLTRLAPLSDRWAAVSEAARGAYPEQLRERVEVVAGGTGPLEVSRARDREAGRELRIGFVGRFSHEKDPLAVCRAVQAMPGAVAIMHGLPSDGGNWIEQAGWMLPPDRLRIVGPEVPVPETYAEIDCLVSTSPLEGFGLTICEAAQAGIPVVSSLTGLAADRPELCEIVPSGADGPTLAAAIRRAMEDRDRVTRAREVCRREYSAAAMARRWGDFIAGVVSR